MNIPFQNDSYSTEVWRPARGRIADIIAYDTETSVIEDGSQIQDFVIGSVFDWHAVYFIRRQDLAAFWEEHRDCQIYMHSASFDMEVTTKATGFDFHPMVEAGRIVDISILYRLLRTATKGDVAKQFNLALMSKELLGVELNKDETIRKGFGQFMRDGVVNYRAIPAEYLTYSGQDAVATFRLGELLETQCRAMHEQHTLHLQNGTTGTDGMTALQWGILGHYIQLRGDIALRAIEHFGVTIDPAAVEQAEQNLDAMITQSSAVLAKYGYIPGKPGNRGVFDNVVRTIATQLGVDVPLTEKTGAVSQAEDGLTNLSDHEFIDAFLKRVQANKLMTSYLSHFKEPGSKVHPHYSLIIKTGRTSCSAPNIQNIPRKGHIRECVIPSSGHVIVTCDYSMLELCTLAQLTYKLYGVSTMRDLINQGVDLHRYTASNILKKPMDEVSKDERQKAKAVSFGLPGGMGVATLRQKAWQDYGVRLSIEEVESWKNSWFALYPEMQRYMGHGDDLERLGATLDINTFPDAYPNFSEITAAAIVMRVAGGNTMTRNGRSFGPTELDWAWQQIANSRAGGNKKFTKDIAARKGSRELQQGIAPGTAVAIPTGRIRANCSFTESKNWPFQALAADGAKLALYDLIRAGYRVVAFIHDEVLIEVPESDDYRSVAEDISRIMIEAMRRVCPDVGIRSEYAAMRRWSKSAKAVYDTAGHLIPFDDRKVS